MKRLTLIITLFFSIECYAQTISANLVTSSGGSFNQVNGKLDWTLGESIIETYKANNVFLTQGFLQGATSSLNTLRENQYTGISFNLFPNPFKSQIQFNISGLSQNQKLNIVIYDILGKEVYLNKELESINILNLAMLANGVYLVEIIIDSEVFKIYRIEKLD